MKIKWTEESLDQLTNIEAYIAKDARTFPRTLIFKQIYFVVENLNR